MTAISAPTAGSTQRGTAITITFTVQSYEVATCSITVKYSTDGETFSNATITGTVTALTVSSAGNEYSVTWDSVADLGQNVKSDNVVIGIVADDASGGGGNDDRLFLSSAFIVDNLPSTPTITSPTNGSFGQDTTPNVEFTLGSQDPGAGEMFPYVQADLVNTFDSAQLVEVDSNDGTDHARFDHHIDTATNKPIPGYLIKDVSVSGPTTVTYASETDAFTNSTLPTTISNARAIVIQKADRRVFGS